MTDAVTLEYQYYYQDAAIIPWRQDAADLANNNQDQSVQIPRYSDVIYLSLFLFPAGMGPVNVCLVTLAVHRACTHNYLAKKF